MSEPTCTTCRFGVSAGHASAGEIVMARCDWVTGTQDEAGDRMPSWAHEALKDESGIGADDRAEDCPAYEART